jgi:hypothetical protein
MCVWDKQAGFHRRWSGVAWNAGQLAGSALIVNGRQVVGARGTGIASPSGGTIIDAEARSVLASVLVTLRTHGLIE